MSKPGESTLSDLHEYYQRTYDRINWSKILEIAQDTHGHGVRCTFGALKWGGLHLVRFIQFDNGDAWVARIPLLPGEDRPWSVEEMEQIREQMKSEHATRKYLNDTKCLPFSVPEIYAYSPSHDGDGVGLPWTLMTKLEGEPLIDFWRNPRPEDKAAVYRQFAEIYLALYQTRFPAVGSLFVRDGSDEIYVGPPVSLKVAPIPCTKPDGTPWSTALEYHTQWYTDRLLELRDRDFGYPKWSSYTLTWILRSFVPIFLSVGEQEQGFPLRLSDFHFQNFLATVDGDSPPKITGIIDFDGATTVPWANFALPPLCLDDSYDGNFEYVKESREDRALFLQQLEDLERASNPSLPPSTLFRGWRPRWLMHKLVEMSSAPEECEFFNLVYGTDEDRAKGMFEYFAAQDEECPQPVSKQAENEDVDKTPDMNKVSPIDDEDGDNEVDNDKESSTSRDRYEPNWYASDIEDWLQQRLLRSVYRRFEAEEAIFDEVNKITGFSGHLSRRELMTYVASKKADHPELEQIERKLLDMPPPPSIF